MRINEIDLQTEDIMWFAIDSNGYIFECTSAGRGNVPEYICCSKENTDKLLDYFTNKAPVLTKPILLIPEENNYLIKEITDLSSKGIFCYDIDEDDENYYTAVAKPETPITIKDLPEEVQSIISSHVYDGNITTSKRISVPHAY